MTKLVETSLDPDELSTCKRESHVLGLCGGYGNRSLFLRAPAYRGSTKSYQIARIGSSIVKAAAVGSIAVAREVQAGVPWVEQLPIHGSFEVSQDALGSLKVDLIR